MRLLLADDHEDVLRQTQELLATEFDVVATVRDGGELISAALRLKPDVIVSDIGMPRLSGIEAIREVLCQDVSAAVILLTMHTDSQLVKSALEAGTDGYVLKVNAGQELIPAIHEALRGGIFVSRDVER